MPLGFQERWAKSSRPANHRTDPKARDTKPELICLLRSGRNKWKRGKVRFNRTLITQNHMPTPAANMADTVPIRPTMVLTTNPPPRRQLKSL
jgi:hypothetical protein